jgi:RNA polymerase sigma factor (sigma-70 family)
MGPTVSAAEITEAMTSDELVAAARAGDRPAWRALLDRYLPLVRAVARGHRLADGDVDDVAQTVCLRLVEHLDRIRDPSALPGWLAVTARHESLRLLRGQRRTVPIAHFEDLYDDRASRPDLDTDLLRVELARAVRAGLSQLPRKQRDLLLLISDGEPRSYREIGKLLAMPVGSIGPTMARGLTRLRATPTVRAYLAGTGIQAA